jgi:hypothetical protein
MIVKLGDVVTTTESTTGTVTDIDHPYESALVQLFEGPDLDHMDTSHGRWYGYAEITAVVGYRPDAMVWSGASTRPAREVNRYTR